MCKYGVSKENRPNPIVQMGLFMDGDGIPLACCLADGNTNEQKTLKPLEEEIIRDFGNAKFIVCTDAGLSSVSNRKFNNVGGRAFITTQSIKKMKDFQKEWALSADEWHLTGEKGTFNLDEIYSDEEKHKAYYDRIFYKEQWFNEVYTLNEDKIHEEIYDGFYAVATNLEDTPEKIISINKGRWEIEESLRIMKSEFQARPVYLRKDNRILAHFTTCFLALTVFRY